VVHSRLKVTHKVEFSLAMESVQPLRVRRQGERPSTLKRWKGWPDRAAIAMRPPVCSASFPGINTIERPPDYEFRGGPAASPPDLNRAISRL
jgi:hypothetical protein